MTAADVVKEAASKLQYISSVLNTKRCVNKNNRNHFHQKVALLYKHKIRVLKPTTTGGIALLSLEVIHFNAEYKSGLI